MPFDFFKITVSQQGRDRRGECRQQRWLILAKGSRNDNGSSPEGSRPGVPQLPLSPLIPPPLVAERSGKGLG